MRILGIDYGTKSIGLSISKQSVALPYGVINSTNTDEIIIRLRQIIDLENISRIVVGLPYKYDGSVGRRAKTVLKLVEVLKQALSIPVEIYDERLSTFEAQELLQGVNISRRKKKQHLDAVAAQLILQRYLSRS